MQRGSRFEGLFGRIPSLRSGSVCYRVRFAPCYASRDKSRLYYAPATQPSTHLALLDKDEGRWNDER